MNRHVAVAIATGIGGVVVVVVGYWIHGSNILQRGEVATQCYILSVAAGVASSFAGYSLSEVSSK